VERFVRLSAVAAPLDLPNVDTDRIVPARDAFRKQALLEGLDDIGLTLRHDTEIGAFETRHVAEWSWAVPGRLDGDPSGKRAGAGQ
jgi:3-isopropylmalate dehydratase small subunit